MIVAWRFNAVVPIVCSDAPRRAALRAWFSFYRTGGWSDGVVCGISAV